jgi:NADPH:quinone reductase-like Zn-dependent oxidoreductase
VKITKTMKAFRIHSYGGSDVLAYEDASRPASGVSEALVAVRSAGINPVNWKIREGPLKDRLQYRFPFTPGWTFRELWSEPAHW